MRAVVVQFPGSNADFDAYQALSQSLGATTSYVFHKATALPAYEAGTWGPQCSEEMLARRGHTWRIP